MFAKKIGTRVILWITAVLAALALTGGAAADSGFSVAQTEYTIQQGGRLRIVGMYTPEYEQERIFHAIYGSDNKLIGAWYVEENQPVQGYRALWLSTAALHAGSYQVVIYPAYFANGKWNRSESRVKCSLTVVGHQTERWDREENYTVHYNSEGIKDIGFTVIDGDLYYFDPDGALQTNGWASIDGNDYYFDEVGRARTGVAQIQGDTYFFDEQGVMRTGLREAEGSLYYFGADGKSVRGLVILDGKYYFFGEDGRGITGRAEADGRRLYFENGTEKPDPSLEQTSAFVRRCYSLILGREADEGGLNNWVNELLSGNSNAATIISNFLGSTEFTGMNKTNDETVEILYNTMLDRPADPAGKAGWVEVLNTGNDSNAVINGFCGSNEFLKICDDYGITAGSVAVSGGESATGIGGFVDRCYREALGRGSDEGGFNHWCGILTNREQTPIQVAWGFVFSPEMDAARKITEDPDALLGSLYRLYLGREPDPDGKTYWKDRIAGGMTLEELNDGFAYSAEFSGIVNSFGLE